METMDPDPDHCLLYIKVRQQTVDERGSLYEAVRSQWRVNPNRAEKATWVVAAMLPDICRSVFAVHRWEPSERNPEKWQFVGRELPVDHEVARRYVGKRIPAAYRGGQNPIRYGW